MIRKVHGAPCLMLFARISSISFRDHIRASHRFAKFGARMLGSTSVEFRSIEQFGRGENTIPKYLTVDEVELKDGSSHYPRQVRRAHYTHVLPEPVPQPTLVAASISCAEMLNLKAEELNTSAFVEAMSGNKLLPGLDKPYATVYGCHSFGQWFGQLGDGRALSIGDVYTTQTNRIDDLYAQTSTATNNKDPAERDFYGDHVMELQLKGCGRSPYSRGFDGRAVVRSSVREFLVSEAMHHLGVPTTRALSVVWTGQAIRRAWYNPRAACAAGTAGGPGASVGESVEKRPPDQALLEPGAVLCRVSRSFLRFGHLELFAQRQEFEQLRQLADFVCFREFPELLEMVVPAGAAGAVAASQTVAENTAAQKETTNSTTVDGEAARLPLPDKLPPGPVERYLALYRRVAQRTAKLVAHWLRVGYVQGNMNSDNTLLSGATIDYGPYGWMERYDPLYQPFTSDPRGNFAFARQPGAMNLNVAVLGETTIAPLVRHVFLSLVTDDANYNQRDLDDYLNEVRQIAEVDFVTYFLAEYNEVKRRKLGLAEFRSTPTASATDTAGVGAAGAVAAERAGSDPAHLESSDEEDEDSRGSHRSSGGTGEALLGPDEQLWRDLTKLMASSDVDFTIFFRELSSVAELYATTCCPDTKASGVLEASAEGAKSTSSQEAAKYVPVGAEVSLFPNIPYAVEQSQSQEQRGQAGRAAPVGGDEVGQARQDDHEDDHSALHLLMQAFYDPAKISGATTNANDVAGKGSGERTTDLQEQWLQWLHRYGARIREDAVTGRLAIAERKHMQNRANPRYVLRNWMAALAYERADVGDYSLIHELTALLEHPYDEPTAPTTPDPASGAADKWYQKTPAWARHLPGVAYMS